MTSVLSAIYTKEYPTQEELEGFTSIHDLQTFTKGLEDDVAILEEETRVFETYRNTREKETSKVQGQGAAGDEGDEGVGGVGGGFGGIEDLAGVVSAASGGAGAGSGGTKKSRGRGAQHRRKSVDQKELFLAIEDKQTIIAVEQDRLKKEREENKTRILQTKDLEFATVEEAQNRIKELKLEMAFFKREVISDKPIDAEKVVKFFADRPKMKEQIQQKLSEKCRTLEQQIAKSEGQLKQRENLGETFHAIDFDQLKIENHQFNERITQKNAELVELKGTTTRTVQSLNSHTDRLNGLITEQNQLKKELKARQDYVLKVQTEIDSVQKEATGAQRKNTALKLQHEAVKVPKVEEYIAQKAEMYELEKAAQNWRRKVEIAAGHVAVMKQQMLSIKKKQTLMASVRGAQSR